MARKYGQDTDSAKSASEEVNKLREEDALKKQQIEKIIAGVALGIGIIFFITKILGAVGDSKAAADYRVRTEEYRQILAAATPTDPTTESGATTETGTSESTTPTESSTPSETSAGTDESNPSETTPTSQVDEDTVVRQYISDNPYNAGVAVANEQNRLVGLVASGELSANNAYMSTDILNTYFESPSTDATRMWGRFFTDSNVNIVWVFDTNYTFESHWIEGSTGGPNPPSNLTVVWRCYASGDEIAQTKLLGYVTATYNPYTQVHQERPDGYFSNVSIHSLTGWGSSAMDIQQHTENPTDPTAPGAPATACDTGEIDNIEDQWYQEHYGGGTTESTESSTPTTTTTPSETTPTTTSGTTEETVDVNNGSGVN